MAGAARVRTVWAQPGPRAGSPWAQVRQPQTQKVHGQLAKGGFSPLSGVIRGSRRFTANTKGPANPCKLLERGEITREMENRTKIGKWSRSWPGGA